MRPLHGLTQQSTTSTGAFEVGDGIVALTLRPFELVTLRLTRS